MGPVTSLAARAGAVVALFGASTYADPPRWSAAAAAGVRLTGQGTASSVGVSREPRYVLRNLTGEARVVELVSLASLSGTQVASTLSIRSPRRVVLAPRASRAIQVEYSGQPVHHGGGLSYYRFELTISVHGQRASAIASNYYVCRIPIRRQGTTPPLDAP